MIMMERINLLLTSSLYRDYLGMVEEKEKDRIFCRHGFSHSLDVARLCWIFLLEIGQPYERDVVYAAALLHDLGRCQEDSAAADTACHAVRSAQLAGPILAAAGYSLPEQKLITGAIAEHRNNEGAVFASSLSYCLSRADKYSRLCSGCPAAAACYKKEEMPQRSGLLY